MDDLTARQREALEIIRAAVRRNGAPPSRQELAKALKIRYAGSVKGHLKALRDKGYIEILPDVSRGIRLLDETDTDLPIVDLVKPIGEVATGEPILAESRIVSKIPRSIAEWFSPSPDYFLTVRGTSMSRAGMHDGDIVAVRASPVTQTGEIVVARFGDEVTIKRFKRVDPRHVELHP